jgi:omega-amidase
MSAPGRSQALIPEPFKGEGTPVTASTLPLRVAIAQIPMHWEMADNVRTMQHAMQRARGEGAAVCAFAELAVTGFHRRVVEWAQPELIDAALAELRRSAAALGIAAAFGAPTFAADGSRFNSHLFVDARGDLVGVVSKGGLTAPEATFFAAGHQRPVLTLAGVPCSAVICREIEDHDQLTQQLAGSGVRVLFWPGQMRPDPAKPPQDPPEHVLRAQALARATGAAIVQTNWPNALNRPDESAHTGRSACIGADGELLFRLPEQGFGIGVFNLGDRHHDWHPV